MQKTSQGGASPINLEKAPELTDGTLLIRQPVQSLFFHQGGDVLLTDTPSLQSRAIKFFRENSEYSHAAIFVSPLHVFEADEGVEISPLLPVGETWIDSLPTSWYQIPGQPRRATIYRHPQIGKFDQKVFERVYNEMMEEYYGRDYPPLSRLVAATGLPEKVQNLGGRLVMSYEKFRPTTPIPGLFCSELIAEFYRRLGLPLFPDGREPATVHPDDLAHSVLEKQPDEIVARGSLKNLQRKSEEDTFFYEAMAINEKINQERAQDLHKFRGLLDKAEAVLDDYIKPKPAPEKRPSLLSRIFRIFQRRKK